MTKWVPYTERRGRCRPKRQWSDKINKIFGSSWMRLANDKSNWRGLVKAYAQKWMVEGAHSRVAPAYHIRAHLRWSEGDSRGRG